MEKENRFDIRQYLKFLCAKYGIHINLHDIAGISQIDHEMSSSFAPYLYHNNKFCNYIKRKSGTLPACTYYKEKELCRQCQDHAQPFYTHCYMGVGEFIYPIRWNGQLIALICVGQFYISEADTLDLLAANAGKYKIPFEEIRQCFFQTAKPLYNLNADELHLQIGLLAENLALRYGAFLRLSAKAVSPEFVAETHKQNYIINQTLTFIHENYMHPLSLKILAGNCYCSSPYLSALFKERVGNTLTHYIGRFRIEKAKELLDITNISITEIGYQCGFNNPNYFARIFKKYTELTPGDYRRRNTL